MDAKKSFLDKIMKGNTFSMVNPNPLKQTPVLTDEQMGRAISAVKGIETGGLTTKQLLQAHNDPYRFKQPAGGGMGMANGAYQFTDEGIKTDVNRGIVNQTTASNMDMPVAQDIYMKNIFQHYTKLGYTPQQIADIHRKGFKNSDIPGGTRYQSPGYVEEFNRRYNAPAAAQVIP
jgi:hypothetical protein